MKWNTLPLSNFIFSGRTHVHLTMAAIVSLGLAPLTIATAWAQPNTDQQSPAADDVRQYAIPAGPLNIVLTRFSEVSGVFIAGNLALAADKNSAGLQGSYSAEQALTVILSGTGLVAARQSNGAYALAEQGSASVLPAVEVSANTLIPTGTAAEGYSVNEISGIGPWAERSYQDTPYSIKAISHDWIENAFVNDTEGMAKVTPAMQFSNPTNAQDSQAPTIRGFSLYATTLIDGVNLTLPAKAISMEGVERIEVLSGLSGFMYGVGNVGGTINYVTKRPTQETLRSLRVGNYGGQQYFANIDLGGKIDDGGKFAYRFNAAYQDGETAKNDQAVERAFVSGALDWHVNDNLLLQLDASHRDNTLEKPNQSFRFASDAIRPEAFDGEETYSPPWVILENEANRAGLNATWNINETFDLRVAYKYKDYEITQNRMMYAVLQAGGLFTNPYGIYDNAPRTEEGHAAYTYLDSRFNTGPVKHTLTVGVSGDTYNNERFENSSIIPDSLSYTLEELNTIAMPDFPDFDKGRKYRASRKEGSYIIIGDDIRFNDNWSALIGVNHAMLKSFNYNADGEQTQKYDDSATTPTLSLIYSPIQSLTTYITFIEALEEGVIVGDTYANAGEVLDPLISTQYEVGAKYSLSPDVIISSALFRIEKANQYSDNALPTPTYVQDGLQVNQGVELSITGKITDNLTLVSGGTFMDLNIEEANDPALEGKEPTEKASVLAKAYFEYNVPALRQLSLTGGAYYTGESYGDRQNTDVIPDYTLFDAGLRYDTAIADHTTKFNLNVTNLTDKKYWTNSYYAGNPRTVTFSVKTDF